MSTAGTSSTVAIPPVREQKQFRIVGQPIPRHDAEEKLWGRTLYAADWYRPGMLHAKVLRSPYPSARILSIDTSEAEKHPGVVCVLTAKDVPNNILSTDVPGQTTEVGPLKARIQVLADGIVRYQGEPVALVAAETEEAAEEALELIKVEYERLPGVYDPEEALKEGAPQVHPEGNLLARWEIREGDVEAALAQADVVVEQEYRTQFIDHAYIEPEAGVGWLDQDGVITLRVSTQVIEHYRDVARVLGVPENKVRVIGPYVGGGFGGKEDVTVEVFLGLIVQRTGRPVRMVWKRQESLVARSKRHPMIMRYRTGATKTGELVAQDVEIIADAGAYAYLSPLVLLYSTVHAQGPYRIPNVRVRAKAVYTNNCPTSAMRGFGGMQVTFGYESQMDLLARKLGIDPAELREKNYIARGDYLAVGQQIESEAWLAECARKAWEALGERSQPSGPNKRVGRGMASNLQSYGRMIWINDWSSAWIGFEMDGSLVIRTGVPDIGGGQASALVQIASEILGVPRSRISIYIGDSALTPLAGTTTATRQLYMSGNAVLLAARRLRESVVKMAARLLEVAEEDVDLADGYALSRSNPAHRVELPKVLAECAREGMPRSEFAVFRAPAGKPVALETGKGPVFPDFTFGSHAVEVEVDVQTGHVRILKYAACHDVGRAINPRSVEGQIEGAVAMGIGQALSEEVVLVEGINQTSLFSSYLIPTSMEIPDIQSIYLESESGKGPFGAKGIGEPPIGLPSPAIANAIHDAVGVRITELPITPERILQALGKVPTEP